MNEIARVDPDLLNDIVTYIYLKLIKKIMKTFHRQSGHIFHPATLQKEKIDFIKKKK